VGRTGSHQAETEESCDEFRFHHGCSSLSFTNTVA
jgi:hypothetical protein